MSLIVKRYLRSVARIGMWASAILGLLCLILWPLSYFFVLYLCHSQSPRFRETCAAGVVVFQGNIRIESFRLESAVNCPLGWDAGMEPAPEESNILLGEFTAVMASERVTYSVPLFVVAPVGLLPLAAWLKFRRRPFLRRRGFSVDLRAKH